VISASPLISVIMPVRNGERWLALAIESLLAQTELCFELLVVDDGSTDGTPSLLQNFREHDDRVRVITQEPLGLVAALNRGVFEAQAPFIARLDADDRSMPTRFERQIEYLKAHPEVGLVGTWAEKIDQSGRVIGYLKPETDSFAIASILQHTNPMVHSSMIMRAAIVKKLGGYRAAFQGAEDYDLWLRMSELTKVANIPKVLVQYRWHSDSVTNKQGIRQAFSVRLAQRSMNARRRDGSDPAQVLTGPPNWHSLSGQELFYADDAKLYQVLDLADPARLWDESCDKTDLTPLLSCEPKLRHSERQLAVLALARHIRRASSPNSRRSLRLLAQIVWENPRFGLKGIWRTLLFRGR
jgi:glycosyltransferase involved in cell wall biosynthesis